MTSTMRFNRWENSLGQPYGTVLQVVQVVKSDAFSVATTSLTNITGLSASITPRFASSKVLIILSLDVDASADLLISGDITRDGTAIGVGDALGSRIRTGWIVGTPSGNRNHNLSYSFLDSPATISAITYQARVRSNAGTAFINRSSGDSDSTTFSRSISSITLMEIAQ